MIGQRMCDRSRYNFWSNLTWNSQDITYIQRISCWVFLLLLFLYYLLCVCARAFSYVFNSFSSVVVYHFSENAKQPNDFNNNNNNNSNSSHYHCFSNSSSQQQRLRRRRQRQHAEQNFYCQVGSDISIKDGCIVTLSLIFRSLFWLNCCCLVTNMHEFTRIINIHFV